MNAKLTVIIPIYNGEEYLHRCIDSVVNQTYQNMEIILVDNKSTDATGEICDEYERQDSRIRVIHRSEHGWISDGRDDGLEAATGEWITFVDADDWIELDFYEEMFKRMPSDRDSIDIFMSGGRYQYFATGVKKLKGVGVCDYTERGEILKLIELLLLAPSVMKNFASLAAVWDKFYRRDFLKQNQIDFPRDILCADDVYFNILAFEKAKRIAGTDYIGYHYWFNPASVTNKYNPQGDQKLTHCLKNMEIYMVEHNIYRSLEESLNCRIMQELWLLVMHKYFNSANKASYSSRKKEFKELKQQSIYHNAIYKSSKKLLPKYRLFSFLLKTPFCFPIEIYVNLKERRIRS